MHLRHFILGGCTHFYFITFWLFCFFYSLSCWVRQFMQRPFSPWLHFLVKKCIWNITKITKLENLLWYLSKYDQTPRIRIKSFNDNVFAIASRENGLLKLLYGEDRLIWWLALFLVITFLVYLFSLFRTGTISETPLCLDLFI